MMMIKDFAKYCCCSIYTLRYYDKVGLLKPEIVDKKSGYRYYSKGQHKEYERIKLYQEIGLSHKDILIMKNLTQQEIIQLIQNQIHKFEYKKDVALQLIKLIEGEAQ